MQQLGTYLAWLLKPPRLQDIWTYCGTWIIAAITTRQSHEQVFGSLIPEPIFAWAAAALMGVAITSTLIRHAFVCSWKRAVIIGTGTLCVGVLSWPYFQLEIESDVHKTLPAISIMISLPLFCRTKEEDRARK
jgi:hypothetical protein